MQVPDSITSWVGEAVGLSEAWGLGVAVPALLKTFKPFFVDFTLPPYVVRGEQAKIPLSVYNYMGTCAEVPPPPCTQPSLCPSHSSPPPAFSVPIPPAHSLPCAWGWGAAPVMS